jgi:hypothetical protein
MHPYAFAGEQSVMGVRVVVRELLAGFLFVAQTRVLLMVTFLALIAMLGAGALNALDIIFALGGLLIVIAGLFGWFALPNPAKKQSTQLLSTPL